MLRRANPNTIQDKILVGYQGWFTCAGDGPPLDPNHHGWLHWFNSPIPSGGRPNIDLWPDTSDYDISELYPAPGLSTQSGDPVHLFSSRHPKTVRRHFRWMAQHSVDGAFLQRFAGQCEIKPGNIAIRDLRDEIGDRVREAAEAEGRVYSIMYDVSGVSPDRIQSILEQDWTHLIRDKQLLDSPSYLRENGRPVVALWGFGLNGRNHTPALVRAIAGFFRSFTPGGVYLVAGTPGHWRTSTSDADRNPEFVQVWTECFDAISPWTVGRFGNEEEADRWGQGRLKADADYLSNLESGGRKVDYIPVVLPGGSGFNLSEGKWHMNDMRRNGGRFLWRQIYNAKRAGVRTIYGAMWDEYDEGTVFMPVVSRASQLPVHPSFRFLALDVDGLDLPSDWYMRIAGLAAEAFHGERTLVATLPIEELKDYWSTRPCYGAVETMETVEATENVDKVEDRRGKEPADVDAVTRSVKALEISLQRSSIDIPHDAPPPYSLEYASQQQGQQPQPSVQAPASRAGTSAPSVRRDTRPSPSLPPSLMGGMAAAAGIPLAADALAHTLSPSSTSPPPSSALPKPSPPPVNMSSRPAPPPLVTRPSYQPSEIDPPPFAHDARPQYAPTYPLPYEHGRGPSAGGVMYAPPAGPPPGAEHPRGRGRGRSHSRSRSKSRSRSPSRRHQHRRSRSRSSSSSKSRKGGRPPVGVPHGYAPLHGHAQSLGHGYGYGSGQGHEYGYGYGPGTHPCPHAPGLGHSHTFSSGSAPPPPGAGVYDTYGGGGGGGQYTPVHSHPVGYGHDMGHGQPQPPPQGYAGGAYVQSPGPQPGGYAYGLGQGQGQGQGYGGPGSGPQGYGYTPHPSSEYYPSGPYPPGGSGSGNVPPGSGGGGGGLQGGFATALNKVEGIAGKQTRQQLEKTVGSLLNKFR